jgi:hypothetical protein
MVMKASGDFVHLLQLLQHSPVLTAYLSRQFNLKNGEWKVKPKKRLRNILLFKKNEHATGVSPTNDVINAKVHVNNHKAENGHEIVRNLSGMKKFVYILSPN